MLVPGAGAGAGAGRRCGCGCICEGVYFRIFLTDSEAMGCLRTLSRVEKGCQCCSWRCELALGWVLVLALGTVSWRAGARCWRPLLTVK